MPPPRDIQWQQPTRCQGGGQAEPHHKRWWKRSHQHTMRHGYCSHIDLATVWHGGRVRRRRCRCQVTRRVSCRTRNLVHHLFQTGRVHSNRSSVRPLTWRYAGSVPSSDQFDSRVDLHHEIVRQLHDCQQAAQGRVVDFFARRAVMQIDRQADPLGNRQCRANR